MKSRRLFVLFLSCALAASFFYTWVAVATWRGDLLMLLLLSDVLIVLLLAHSLRAFRALRARRRS